MTISSVCPILLFEGQPIATAFENGSLSTWGDVPVAPAHPVPSPCPGLGGSQLGSEPIPESGGERPGQGCMFAAVVLLPALRGHRAGKGVCGPRSVFRQLPAQGLGTKNSGRFHRPVAPPSDLRESSLSPSVPPIGSSRTHGSNRGILGNDHPVRTEAVTHRPGMCKDFHFQPYNARSDACFQSSFSVLFFPPLLWVLFTCSSPLWVPFHQG